MIGEIHILHHTHTDLGYTDLPTTCLDLQVSYLLEAMAAAEATAHADEAARFRWTCEVSGSVEELLRRHPEQRERLARLVAAGQMEVCALPWNLSTHLVEAEWAQMRELCRPLWQEFGTTVVMQNDVNGLSWGMIPGLVEEGITGLVMGPNSYSGGTPLPRSTAFWWEGPDGKRLTVWLSGGYCEAYSWFHASQWRQGPVPRACDPWFSRPAAGEIWNSSPQGLEAAQQQLKATLSAGHLKAYPHGVIACQLTNQWRMDNDPPHPGLSAFVAAWNRAGLTPRIVLSTPRRFFTALGDEVGEPLPVVRGDWTDWWADAIPSVAPELALGQRTKARLARLPALADALGLPRSASLDALWRRSFVWTEHTFSSYESGAYPWRDTTLGQECQLLGEVYRLAEDTAAAEGSLLRATPDFCSTSQTGAVVVVDVAGRGGGWVEIPGRALRQPASGLVDPATGRKFPFEDELGSEWVTPDAEAPRPLIVPDDVWGFVVTTRRAWVPTQAPCTSLELYADDACRGGDFAGPLTVGTERGEDAHWAWVWDSRAAAGPLISLIHRASGRELIDATSPLPFAALVWEQMTGWAPWLAIDSRHGVAERLAREVPPAVEATLVPSHYGFHAHWRREHPGWYACQQDLRLLPDGAIEVNSEVWLREHMAPVWLWLALPLAGGRLPMRYDALGWPTQMGRDQMPNVCGEYLTAGRWIAVDYPEFSLSLDCTDTPVVCIGELRTRSGATATVPQSAHLMPCMLSTAWSTNFPHTRSQHLRLRHVLRAAAPAAVPVVEANLPLPCYPSRSEGVSR